MATNEESLTPVSPKPKEMPPALQELMGNVNELKKLAVAKAGEEDKGPILLRLMKSEKLIQETNSRIARLETNIKKHMEANGEVYKQ
jgi:hypothetical protein